MYAQFCVSYECVKASCDALSDLMRPANSVGSHDILSLCPSVETLVDSHSIQRRRPPDLI